MWCHYILQSYKWLTQTVLIALLECFNIHWLQKILSNQKHPSVKRGSQDLKHALLKDGKSDGQPIARLSGLTGLKVLAMMTSLQNIVISGAQGLLMLMGSKFLIKKTRPWVTAAWMIIQNSINLFKTPLVVYPVGMTKDFEHFSVILSSISSLISLKISEI